MSNVCFFEAFVLVLSQFVKLLVINIYMSIIYLDREKSILLLPFLVLVVLLAEEHISQLHKVLSPLPLYWNDDVCYNFFVKTKSMIYKDPI